MGLCQDYGYGGCMGRVWVWLKKKTDMVNDVVKIW